MTRTVGVKKLNGITLSCGKVASLRGKARVMNGL
jgi:hypothetical protein